LIVGKSAGVYNLSSGKIFYLQEIVKLIHKTVGNHNTLEFGKKNHVETKWICGNNLKISKESGILSNTDLLTGLLKTINFYKDETLNND
jgi:hypothetical protein